MSNLPALIVAITSLVSAIGGVIALFRRVGGVSDKVDTVHGLVNNQLDRQLKYNQQLAGALTAAGQAVPEQEEPPSAASPASSRPG